MNKSDIPAQLVNRAFIDMATSSDPEMVKEAKVSATSFTRDILREEGFARNILTPIPLGDEQLNRSADSDKPFKIVELEPGSAATYVSFRGMPDSKYFTGKFAEAHFGRIVSEEYSKVIWELKVYDNDIRKIIADNSNKDIMAEEDGKLISTVEGLVAANPTEQLRTLSGGLTRTNLIEFLKTLPKLKKPNGCLLMNDVTAKEILKWDSNDIGDAASTDQYYNGLSTSKILGIKSLFTIKRELVPDNVVYAFAPEDFLGKFFTMQDATVYMETRADLLKWFTYEIVSITITNTKAVAKGVFV